MLLDGLAASLLAGARAVTLVTEAICGSNMVNSSFPAWDLWLQEKTLSEMQ